MTGLGDLVRRLPRVFYIAAAVMFVWSLGNAFVEMGILYQTSGLDETTGAMPQVTKSKALYYALTEALYLVANGAVIQVLIAIHDRVGKE
ncbi:MAG: hypothetical protein KGZ65_04780 [Sphingomonadales bacterium]|nr:hypothetical protein [Sphingomonadales bacterium]